MSKTIIYVGGFELPDKNAAAHRVLSVAKAMRDNGHNVILVGVSKNEKREICETKTDVQGFEAYSVAYPRSSKDWIRYLTNIDDIKKIISSQQAVDAVICYNYQAIALQKLRRYCNKRNINVLADCTEWYNTDGASIIFKALKGFDIWFRMKVVHKRLDGLIVISRYLADYYKKQDNVLIIPPLVDVNEEKWAVEPKKLGENINFIYSGKPGNKDKIYEIVKALLELDGQYKFDLWIIGITESQFKAISTECADIKLTDNMHFLGYLSHTESLAYVKGADCSLIIRNPTRTNNAGFPTKFAEAVTLGIDVIATDISDLKDYENKIDSLYISAGSLKDTFIDYIEHHKDVQRTKKYLTFDYRNWLEKIDSIKI